MPPLERYLAAACQFDLPCPRSREAMRERTEYLLGMIDQAVAGYSALGDVRLVLFPEFAQAAPVYASVAESIERLAVTVPNEHTDRYAAKARELGIYIQTGTFLELDARWPGHVFNTTCLIGPAGLLSRYRKLQTWLPFEVHTSPHDLPGYDEPLLPVVDTEIGKLGAAICYDWLFPELVRQLGLSGAEVLLRVSAYMDPWASEPLDWWTLFNRARAVENMAYVVAANQACRRENFPPYSWPGRSMIVDYDGRVLAQADPGPCEKIVVAPIDLAALRAERARRQAHQLVAHLRSELYGLPQPIYAASTPSSAAPTVDGNRQATELARQTILDRCR